MTVALTSFVMGMDSPVTIQLVNGAATFDHNSIDWHLLTRPNSQSISNLHLIERYPPRHHRHANDGPSSAQDREAREWPTGAFTRLQLQDLTEQN